MMSFSELYSALQTGVVDGAENNPPSLLTQNHYQITKFYSLTGHLIIPEIFIFSRRSWETLSKEDQDLIKKFSREAQLEQRTLWDAMVADSVQKLKAAGVQFIEVDKKPFYEATKPVREKYGAKHLALIKRMEETR
jgi:TRAP-type C4-dicarboxylate transport system substrate-binding protein